MHGCAVGAIIGGRASIDVVLLSAWPAEWLPGFFLAQAAVGALVLRLLLPQIRAGTRRAGMTVAAVALLGWPATSMVSGALGPLAVSLWLTGLSTLLGVVSWNAAADAFDIREFKAVAPQLAAAGTVGAMAMGLVTPLAVERSVTALTAGVAGVAAVAGVLAASMEAVRHPAPTRDEHRPERYPLFVALAAGAFLLACMSTLTDFALKRELSLLSDPVAISRVIGPFYAVSTAATLAAQTLLTQRVLRRTGLLGLLSVGPVLCLLGTPALILAPSLLAAEALRFGEQLGHYAFGSVGRECAGSPLPSSVRRAGKAYLKGMITPLGVIAASGLLLVPIIGEGPGLPLTVAALGVVWLAVNVVIARRYREALLDSLRGQRLAMSDSRWDELVNETALQIVGENEDPERIRFGIGLLRARPPTQIPDSLLALLNAREASVRADVLRLVLDLQDILAVPALSAHLPHEQDPEVLGLLLTTLARLDPDPSAAAARQHLDSPHLSVRSGAVRLLMACDAGAARGALKRLSEERKARARRAAAEIIAEQPGPRPAPEVVIILERLVRDRDPAVRRAALRAVGAQRVDALCEEVVSQLGLRPIAFTAGQALVRLGTPALPPLLKMISEGELSERRTAARLLLSFRPPLPVPLLLSLLTAADPFTRAVLIRDAADLAVESPWPLEFRRGALRLAEEEAGQLRRTVGMQTLLLEALRSTDQRLAMVLGLSESDHGPSLRTLRRWAEVVARELRVRRALIEARLLGLLAICEQPRMALEAGASIRRADPGTPERAAAIELLESELGDRQLAATVSALEATGAQPTTTTLRELDDPWLNQLVAHPPWEATPMDLVQRSLLLRRVALFCDLPGEVLMSIAERCEPREMVCGEHIVQQGLQARSFFIIASGKVGIYRDRRRLAQLQRGDFFGEISLLSGDTCSATGTCESDGELLLLDAPIFDLMVDDHPQILRKLINRLLSYISREQGVEALSTGLHPVVTPPPWLSDG